MLAADCSDGIMKLYALLMLQWGCAVTVMKLLWCYGLTIMRLWILGMLNLYGS